MEHFFSIHAFYIAGTSKQDPNKCFDIELIHDQVILKKLDKKVIKFHRDWDKQICISPLCERLTTLY